LNLDHKVVWITGGARMGAAVARVLSQKGCTVVLTYRKSKKAAEGIVRELIDDGAEAGTLPCDLTRLPAIERTARRIVQTYKSLDILVNLSSIYEKSPLSNAKRLSGAWDAHMNANAKSAFQLSLAVAPWMKRAGGGRMVHISDWTSASGRPRYKGYAPYYTSKTAIKGVVEALALELAPEILVNAIAPGPILPPPDLSVREYDAVINATPLARWGGAEEIAKAVLFLVETDFVTGETLRVDGGRHLI
jgi:NAD(P)-dependent dehydrogenase (short-subunit alcohol dehydrogenase family)